MKAGSISFFGLAACLFAFAHADAAVIAYHDASFSNFDTTGTTATQFVAAFDVNVSGTKRAEGNILANNFSGWQFDGTVFSASESTPAELGSDPILRLVLVELEATDSPALSADVSLTFSNFAPGFSSVGLSMTSAPAVWAIDSLANVTFTGTSATVFDNQPGGVDLLGSFGPTASAFASGGTLDFLEANYDTGQGFNSPTHIYNWGLDIAGGTSLQFNYSTAGSVTNVAAESLAFGIVLIPEPSSFALAALGLLGLGASASRRR